jgi:HEPN domain-containing protein
VPTRYPEDFRKLSKEFDKAIAEEYLKSTREIIKWLKKNILKLKSKK